ncbi:DUF732 domain-containing protein [Geodermatophilus sp. CPCC 206100]|uniref:DUF732 domain-containing protein n=1 Tax=Geodermatophilus sp. CPCC 206100 TaxID=3020054 RepID=UPI003B00D021
MGLVPVEGTVVDGEPVVAAETASIAHDSSTGQCPVCDERIELLPNGLIKTHVTDGVWCDGMKRPPVTGTVVDGAVPESSTSSSLLQESPEPTSNRLSVERKVGIAVLVAAMVAFTVAYWGGLLASDTAARQSSSSASSATTSTAPAPSSEAPTPAPQPPVTDTYDPPAASSQPAYDLPASVVEQTFLESIHASGLSAYGSDSQMVQLARATCGALDRGTSFEAAMGILATGGFSDVEAAAYYGLAVASFCPEHGSW